MALFAGKEVVVPSEAAAEFLISNVCDDTFGAPPVTAIPGDSSGENCAEASAKNCVSRRRAPCRWSGSPTVPGTRLQMQRESFSLASISLLICSRRFQHLDLQPRAVPCTKAVVTCKDLEPSHRICKIGSVEDDMMWALHTSPAMGMGVDCILGSIQSFLAKLSFGHYDRAASLWIFFAACGLAELCISFLICTPLERFRPLTSWPKRNSIAADVAYAFFVRIVLFPLVAFFEYDWLRLTLDGFLRAHAITTPSLFGALPLLASWPAVAFILNFAVLDLADYWRHRLSHRVGWWYGIHSLHHAEEQMTFWSDDRSHVLEDAITYVWLIAVGLAIGIPSTQFPFLILCFRLLGSMAHANTRVSYGWLGNHIFISPQFHRTHHALRAAGRRSSNFGTALSVWDILFSTARFEDNTVETGDAGAEQALVKGSWGAQQAAGFRRMLRLARRGSKVPAIRTHHDHYRSSALDGSYPRSWQAGNNSPRELEVCRIRTIQSPTSRP